MKTRPGLVLIVTLISGQVLAQGPTPQDPTAQPARSAPAGARDDDVPPVAEPSPDQVGSPPAPEPEQGSFSPGDVPFAKALEMSGIRSTSTVRLTSEPSGAQILINSQASCQTPCLINLPPGKYTFRFEKQDYKSIETERIIVASEELSLHAKLGDKVPYEVAFPLMGVGLIFGFGGTYGLVNGYSDADIPPEDKARDRNLGYGALAIGVPMVAVAIWLFFSGTDSKVFSTISPSSAMMPSATP